MRKDKALDIAHIHVADKHNKGDVAIVLAVQELFRERFAGCHIHDFSAVVLRTGDARSLRKINTADLVVIGGGGLFYSYFLPYNLDFIAGIKKPIVIFGVGYIREIGAPALDSRAAETIAALVSRAALVGVRDYKTKEFLLKQGEASSRIAVIGDPAVLLREKKTRLFGLADGGASGTAKIKSVRAKERPLRIGFNLNYSGWLGFGEWRQDILRAYREVIDYFQKQYGPRHGRDVEIYYLKHHPGEDNIYPELAVDDLRIVDLPPREQKYVYGQLDLVVGMMLHSGVLAFGAGTPEISVAYDLRNHSFAEFIGHPELVVDLNQLKTGALLKRVKQIFTKREKYGLIFKKQKEMIGRKERNFLAHIQ